MMLGLLMARAGIEVPRRAVARSSSIATAMNEKNAMKTLMRTIPDAQIADLAAYWSSVR